MSSWIGNSFSTLTGQLSNLTKDILTEGTEEVSDHVTELRLAQDKLKELDTVNVSQKIEIDRLKLLVREWEEKAEGSELQINKISKEYRTLLEEKEAEINKLKHENQDLKSTPFVSQQSEPAVLRLDSDNGFDSVSYGGADEHDFGDNIAMQHDINRLRGDLQRLEAECKHWKSLVPQHNKLPISDGRSSANEASTDDSHLQKQIQELQTQLSHEKDQRQHELSVLQDAQVHKISQLRKKHKEEVAELRVKIQEMDWGSEGWEPQPSAELSSLKQAVSTLKEEITSLKSERENHMTQITSLSAALEEHKSNFAVKEAQTLHLENQLKVSKEEISRLVEERDQVGQELYDTKQKLLDQLDANHADTLEVLSDLREVRQHMDMTAIDRRNKLLLEKDKIVNQMVKVGEKKKVLAKNVEKLEAENQSLKGETAFLVQDMGNTEQQTLTAGVVENLEQENLVLKEKNVGLQEQVTLLEKALQNVNQDMANRHSRHASGLLEEDEPISDSGSLTSDLSEMSRRNLELDSQVTTLQDQIKSYEEEIGNFEILQSDWQTEKEALEGVLVELRNELKVKENSLNVVEAQKGLLAVEKHEASKSSLPDLVDETSRDSFEDIAEDVVELDRKVGLLTEANAQLEQDRDGLVESNVRLVDFNSALELERDELVEANTQLEQYRDMLIEEKAKLRQQVIALTERRPRTTSRTTSISESESSEKSSERPSELNHLLKEKENELQSLMTEKEDLEKNLAEVPELKLQLQQKQDEVENLLKSKSDDTKDEDLEIFEKDMEELKKKLRGKNEEIVNLSLEKEEMMQSLEELDNQHQEATEHLKKIKDQLAKSNESLKMQVEKLENEKQALNAELDSVKSQHLMNQADESTSSNELNHQIAELKDEINTMNQRLEKQGSREAEIVLENKTMYDTVKELKEKLTLSAQSLNDLHMDKQELQDKITQLKTDGSRQTEKLKHAREENEKLRKDITDGTTEESLQQSSSAQDLIKAEEENGSLKSELETALDRLKQNQTYIENLQAEHEQLNEKCESLNRTLETKGTEVIELTTKLKDNQIVQTELQENLATVNHDCERLKKENLKKHDECESFSRQLHALESELQPLKANFNIIKKENSDLTSHVEMLNNEVTLLQDNFAAKNDEFEKLHVEVTEVKDLLEDTTDKLHSKCEESNELMDEVEKCKSQYEDLKNQMDGEYDAQLLSATGELVLVKEELVSKTEEWERLDKELYVKDEELQEMQVGMSLVEKENEHLKKEVQSMQQQFLENEKQCEMISSENERLKSDLSSLEQKQASQVKHYESYIEELKLTKDSNNSSLQLDYDELLDKCHKKDLHISEMEAKVTNLFGQMQECQKELETTTEQCEKLQNICDNNKRELSSFEATASRLKAENDSLNESVKQHELSLAELTETREKLDMVQSERDYLDKALKESTDHHVAELTSHTKEKESLSAKVRELEVTVQSVSKQESADHIQLEELMKENDSLMGKVTNLESDIMKMNDAIYAKECSVKDLNEQKEKLFKTIEELKESCLQKDNHLSELQRSLDENETKASEDHEQKILEEKAEKELVNESIVSVHQVQLLGTGASNGDMETENIEHERDIIYEIERLKGQLDQKDNVITELQRNNASLLKMLDAKSKNTGDTTHIEVVKMENEVKALKMEKEQMMDVLNEKSRESSSLKAEVQRLMNVAAAQKTALDKAQKDNHDLSQKSPETDGAHIDDMQKEVVKNLSRIIRDKDLEIESLGQKNQTLLSVLQESSTEGTQINSLMQDKDNLTKQMAALQSEREQMITYLNQKHQESVAYHTEVQRLTVLINSENEKNEKVRNEYEMLIPQFEDKKQALVKTQNELLNYKQKYQELEMKCGQLIQRSDSTDTVDKALYEVKVQESNKQQERYNELMLSLKEKEMKVQSLYQQVCDLEQSLRTAESERGGYKKQVDNFTFQLHGIQTEHGDLKAEVAQLKQQRESITSECQSLRDMNNKLTLQAQDHDFELQSLQEKTKSLTSIVQQQQGEKGQLEQVVQVNEATQAQIRQLTRERDQALLGMQQMQEKEISLQKEIQSLKEKEMKMNRDMSRLREHLIQIEEGYTKEALAAEEREKDLRTRLTTAEESALCSSSAVETANQQTHQQVDSLQQQLHFVSQQRDGAYQQISSLQDQNQMYSGSMTNLQMVLEEFQQDKDRLVAEETERCLKQVTSLREQVNKLQADLKYTKNQLDEASDGLEAAARLSEQLDRKEEAIDALREEVQIRESALKSVEEELRHLKSRNDDRVDKLVIKNLFLGYFTTPQNNRHEVLRTIGGVLLFTADDFERIEGPHKGGWMPGFLRFSGGQKPSSPPSTPVRRSTIGSPMSRPVDNSFSQMFVNFLERESSPPPPTVRLPAEEMARNVQQKQKESQKAPFNPFTAPRHVAMPAHASTATGAHNSHIFISPGSPSTETFPTFAPPSEHSRTPPGSGRTTPASTSSSAILKDVLNR